MRIKKKDMLWTPYIIGQDIFKCVYVYEKKLE